MKNPVLLGQGKDIAYTLSNLCWMIRCEYFVPCQSVRHIMIKLWRMQMI